MDPALGYKGLRATEWLVLVNGLGCSFLFLFLSSFSRVDIFYLLTGLA
jgi:hypothetical protein